MKILVIGASGFLGTKLMNILSKNHEVIGTYSKNKKEDLIKLDATKAKYVRNFLLNHRPDIVIDAIALTSYVACEKNPRLCKLLNYTTARNIAETCKEINAKMIFISSSYIFDGKKGDYKETNKPNPKNEYGKTKVMAEKEVMKYKNSIIIRVDIMYGYNGKNKKNGVFDMILSGNEIKLKDPNQIRQPVLINDVIDAILFLIEKKQKGIFHVAGNDKLNIMEFLKGLEKVVRKELKITVDNKKSNMGSIIKIPKNSTLNNSKIKKLGFRIHSFKEGLEILEKQYSK